MDPFHRRLRISTLVLGAVVFLLLLTKYFLLKNPKEIIGQHKSIKYGSVAPFSLTDQTGKSFGSADLKGKVWVADFIFTRCMGPCPLITTKMAQLQSEFKGKSSLRFVSFSVDPEFDTPAVLTKYANNYGADKNQWLFLTGPKDTVYKLIHDSFHLAADRQPGSKSNISEVDILHSLYLVVVNSDGKIINYFNTSDTDSLNQLRETLKALT